MELKNDRLLVTFAEPKEINTRRFDNTAIVKQVTLDNRYSFCTQEQVLPCRRTTNGLGLCGEFVIDSAEEAKAGEYFCKPGVGLLKQTHDFLPFDMWKSYEFSLSSVSVDLNVNEIHFIQKAVPANGYGIHIEKIFHLEDTSLFLDISVCNAGTKFCSLKEYQHNFVTLNSLPVDNGYILELPCDDELHFIENCTLRQGDEITLPSAVSVRGNEVHWDKSLGGCVLYHSTQNIKKTAPFYWTLKHRNFNLSISEEIDFCPSRLDVWAVEHCICTEFYHSVGLEPGETAHWRRRWNFNAE